MPLFFILIPVVIVLDQATKWWVVQHFHLLESMAVIPGFFDLTYQTNNGAAFSMLAGQPAVWRQIFFVGVNCVALVFIGVAQKNFGRNSRLYTLALALIAGGALGNLIDRIRLGFVVDFLDVYVGTHHWPTFNVADSAITIGVAVFLYQNMVLERRRPE